MSVPGVVEWADVRRVSLGAAVLRDSDYETSDRVIVDSLHDRNQELNRKGGFRRLLSKQGALLILSAEDQRSNTEFKRLVDLASMALCLRRFFEIYPAGRAEAPAYYDFLLNKAVTWVEDPDRVFRDSVTSEHTWRVAACELRLDKDVERLLEQQSVPRMAPPSVRDNTRGFDQGWWANPGLASQLQDVPDADGGTSASTQQVVNIMHAAQVGALARHLKLQLVRRVHGRSRARSRCSRRGGARCERGSQRSNREDQKQGRWCRHRGCGRRRRSRPGRRPEAVTRVAIDKHLA